jgi:hypothetical protein
MKKIKTIKKISNNSKNSHVSLNLFKIEKLCLNIYYFFNLFVFVGLTHFLFISLGFVGFEIYYFYILLAFLFFYFLGKKVISFAFSYGSD